MKTITIIIIYIIFAYICGLIYVYWFLKSVDDKKKLECKYPLAFALYFSPLLLPVVPIIMLYNYIKDKIK
jgi:hypothetical protein